MEWIKTEYYSLGKNWHVHPERPPTGEKQLKNMAKRPRYIIDTEQHPETSPRGTRTVEDRGRREGQACGLR